MSNAQKREFISVTGGCINNAAGQVALSEVSLLFNATALTGPGTFQSFKNNVFYGNKKDGEAPSPVELR